MEKTYTGVAAAWSTFIFIFTINHRLRDILSKRNVDEKRANGLINAATFLIVLGVAKASMMIKLNPLGVLILIPTGLTVVLDGVAKFAKYFLFPLLFFIALLCIFNSSIKTTDRIEVAASVTPLLLSFFIRSTPSKRLWNLICNTKLYFSTHPLKREFELVGIVIVYLLSLIIIPKFSL